MTKTYAIIGQSLGEQHGTVSSSPPTVVNTTTWDGVSSFITPTGNGEVVFGRDMANGLSDSIQIVNSALTATALLAKATLANGYWLDLTVSEPYDNFKVDMAAANSSNLDGILWNQGEREANAENVSEAEYVAGMVTLINRLRTDFTNTSGLSALPIVITGLGRNTQGGGSADDASWQAIREAGNTVEGMFSHVVVTSTSIDLPLDDGLHLTALGYEEQARREALAMLFLLGEVTEYKGQSITRADLDITSGSLTLSPSNNFTPSDSITGFEVSDDNFVTSTDEVGVRKNDNQTLLINYPELIPAAFVRYLYGATPDISNIIYNTDSLPLEWGSIEDGTMASTQTMVDTFTGTNGTLLTAHAPDSPAGLEWVKSGFPTWSDGEIQGNELHSSSGVSANLINISEFPNNTQVITWTMRVIAGSSGSGAGAMTRWTEGSEQDGYLTIPITNSNHFLVQRRDTAGTPITQIGSPIPLIMSAGTSYDLELTVEDNGGDVDFTLFGAEEGQTLVLLGTVTDTATQKLDGTFGAFIANDSNEVLKTFGATYAVVSGEPTLTGPLTHALTHSLTHKLTG